MPTYDYACAACGPFEAVRRIAERDAPLACPRCTAPAARAWAGAPMLADMPAAQRHAIGTNERASHEPLRSRDYARLRHPAGCGCCSPGPRSPGTTAANGAKTFPARRPWMISH
ncbi:MAG TPA: zinc ribbon domain-containing protein [Ideonella sp.]|nr:zinc ribbon domain-containing protein [Ideonella sp.]